jgi:hypothetical protein
VVIHFYYDGIDIWSIKKKTKSTNLYLNIMIIENTYEKKVSIGRLIGIGNLSLPLIIIPLLQKETHIYNYSLDRRDTQMRI